jgi:hypothetical protein
LRGFEVEVVLRHINRAAAFGYERLSMAYTTARVVKLKARAAAEPDTRYFAFIQFGLEVLELMQKLAAGG